MVKITNFFDKSIIIFYMTITASKNITTILNNSSELNYNC